MISTSLVYRHSCSFRILSCFCYNVPCAVTISVLHQYLLSIVENVHSAESLKACNRATENEGCGSVSRIFEEAHHGTHSGCHFDPHTSV